MDFLRRRATVQITPRPTSFIGNGERSRRISTAVPPHEFSFTQDMTLHGAFEFRLGGSGLQGEFSVERVELEIIAVWCAWRRTGTSVADAAKIVAALSRAVG